ncbi:MAG: ester cyclase [Burkholderiaceae bacterium]
MKIKITDVFAGALGLMISGSVLASDGIDAASAREVVAPFYQALNAGEDVEALFARSLAESWTSCADNGSDCAPRAQVAGAIKGFHQAIPDLRWQIKELLVSGDSVIVRGEASGTPAGELFGVAHGGKSFRIMSIDIHRIRDGRIAQSHHIEDWALAIRQLRAH